ncbi:MAG: hypothetical protein LBM93_09055, partial [Oscillospiraceae bacterium]|jgi:hypothetical protein|nr:hypothetical protein [Oscillospiraceae bacterium]
VNGYKTLSKYGETFPDIETYKDIVYVIFDSEHKYDFNLARPYIDLLQKGADIDLKIEIVKHFLNDLSYGAEYIAPLVEDIMNSGLNKTDISIAKMDLLYTYKRLEQDKLYDNYWTFVPKIETYLDIFKSYNKEEYAKFKKFCVTIYKKMAVIFPFNDTEDAKKYLNFCNDFSRLFKSKETKSDFHTHISNIFFSNTTENNFTIYMQAEIADLYIKNFNEPYFMMNYFVNVTKNNPVEMASIYSVLSEIYNFPEFNENLYEAILEVSKNCFQSKNDYNQGIEIYKTWLQIFPQLGDDVVDTAVNLMYICLDSSKEFHITKNLFSKLHLTMPKLKNIFLPKLVEHLNNFYVTKNVCSTACYTYTDDNYIPDVSKAVIPNEKLFEYYKEIIDYFKPVFSNEKSFLLHKDKLEELVTDVECYKIYSIMDLKYIRLQPRDLGCMFTLTRFSSIMLILCSLPFGVAVYACLDYIYPSLNDDLAAIFSLSPFVLGFFLLALSMRLHRKIKIKFFNNDNNMIVPQYMLDLHIYCGEDL